MNELEKEFQSVTAQIQNKINQANKLIFEAMKIADDNDIQYSYDINNFKINFEVLLNNSNDESWDSSNNDDDSWSSSSLAC